MIFLKKTFLLLLFIINIVFISGCEENIDIGDTSNYSYPPNLEKGNILESPDKQANKSAITKGNGGCTASTTFKDGEWRLISIPCKPEVGRDKVRDIFNAEKIYNEKEYAKTWVLYQYNSEYSKYQKVGLDDKVEIGRGYWFTQRTGKDQKITVSGKYIENIHIDLVTKHKTTQYLLGNPFNSNWNISNIKFTNISTGEKYTWKEAKNLNLIDNFIYTYKNSKYSKINTHSQIDPWDGFWLTGLKDNINTPIHIDMSQNTKSIVKLFGDKKLHNFYENSTDSLIPSARENGKYFGIYSMLAKGDTLYLGLGADLPAGSDGALLATYSNDTLSSIASLNEQGISSIVNYGEGIGVPGADPCCGDLLSDDGLSGPLKHEWDWGNFYYINNNNILTKHRNLPKIVHGWGGWYDQNTHTFYYAGSGFVGNTAESNNSTGLLFSTKDLGQTWERVADRYSGIGEYRTYDVLGIANSLYVIYNDKYLSDRGIAKSTDNGKTWKRIFKTKGRIAKLYNIKNRLTFLDHANKSIISIDRNDKISKYSLSFNVGGYGQLAQDNAGNVYAGTSHGYVMKTKDLKNWSQFAKGKEMSFDSITYWAEKNILVLSNWGEQANLWKVEL